MSEPLIELTFIPVVATCRTANCENNGYAAAIYVPDDPWPPSVICGVCAQPIDDVVQGEAL